VRLPDKFLEWNFYGRRRLIERLLREGRINADRLLLEFMRHTPVLCTAAPRNYGTVELNGKVVGVGYVLKREKMGGAIKALREHLKATDEEYEAVREDGERLRRLYEEHSRRGLELLLRYLYLPPSEAEGAVDFEKLATVELAKRLPWSSKHTWRIVQKSKAACLVFFQPPSTSFEVRGILSVHVDDEYHEFVTLVHDAYHYTPPEHRVDRPVYVIHVTEVYDNSPTRGGFGTRLA